MSRSKDVTRELRTTLADDSLNRTDSGQRSAEEVAEMIQDLIISQGLGPGARLPSERDLAALLSTSRPTVSQGIRVLVVRGLVESRRGSGSYVLRRPLDNVAHSLNLALNLERDSVPQLAELRLWLETTGAVRAIDLITDDQIAEIAEILDEYRTGVDDVAAFMSTDTRFHGAIVAAAENPYLTSIYESVHVTLINFEYRSWIASGDTPPWLREDALQPLIDAHRPILSALSARDKAAMREAVIAHHVQMEQHLKESETLV